MSFNATKSLSSLHAIPNGKGEKSPLSLLPNGLSGLGDFGLGHQGTENRRGGRKNYFEEAIDVVGWRVDESGKRIDTPVKGEDGKFRDEDSEDEDLDFGESKAAASKKKDEDSEDEDLA